MKKIISVIEKIEKGNMEPQRKIRLLDYMQTKAEKLDIPAGHLVALWTIISQAKQNIKE